MNINPFRLFCNFVGYIYTMADRMNHYETLDTKVNNKINKVKHLTNYNSTEPCGKGILCIAIKQVNDTQSTLNKITLFIDLIIVEAIDQGKQQDVLELVLEVK